KTDSTPADKTENPGACFTGYDGNIKSEIPAFCGCFIDDKRGVLKITDIDPSMYPPVISGLPTGAYHIYDYQFFYRSLEQNVSDRLNKYLYALNYTDEGVDTECIITGYDQYNKGPDSYFLMPGDKIAVISPSGLPTQTQVDSTVEGLKAWGFEPVLGKYVCPATRTLNEQTEDLIWALKDPSIKGIFCIRGGYGASGVMDNIPLDLIEKSSKPIIGYSDITVYHSAWTEAGLPSIQSCMSVTFSESFPKECKDAQLNLMTGNVPSYLCKSNTPGISGDARGILIGGNLSTFTSVLNTEYDCTGLKEPYILFLEETGENIQHLHRYLTILKHFGVIDNASGIIFGEWTGLPAGGAGNYGATRGGKFETVADMIQREFLEDTNIPIAFGFPAGHGDVNYPLLMGANVTLHVSEDQYTIEYK
ncbi:MAG: LD-carboxypeptidase, partial [Lachnospiraceae bacterium]|nr:LD-carboxypeptidase [Lachnospiraceae bacterium]